MATVRASAIRCAGGAVIALLAALAVLIHHETAAVTDAPAQHATHSTHIGHAMPGMASSSAAAARQVSDLTHADGFSTPAPAHGVGGGTCAVPGMQHCTAGNVEVLKLPMPPQGTPVQSADPYQTEPGPRPVGTVGRAPPDLSVLSRLRL
ncbi:hypothetical protein ACFYN9_09085 [Streptomyces collinus]|uniref:Secreted protein n=1 Tax=Streptomyces violaceochromogenes TaxID=67377 RepID=A0ABU6MAP4_9ACTN|nr:hypothetical protein [Streptomyces violaceochromogenes]MEC7058478.1 hypothetical protein [Streptomyces violaceochromogenes]GHC47253.1 hypothetical protein GCM10010309_02070 [Streptomyces violaceochromogenes]